MAHKVEKSAGHVLSLIKRTTTAGRKTSCRPMDRPSGHDPAVQMTAKTQHNQNPSSNSQERGANLGANIRKSIESPFAALIASISELGSEGTEGDQRSSRVDNAVEMLESVRHGVQALVDLVAPSDADALTCSLDELAHCAVRATPASVRNNLIVAIDDGDSTLNVDGPRISRCLSYLLFANVAPGQEALFHAHASKGCGAFTLSLPVSDAPAAGSSCPTVTHDGYMQLAAERELIRLGGSLQCQILPSGVTRISALLPLAKTVTGDSQ